MLKVTAIENAILALEEGAFQKFCDTFLSKKEKYGAILSLGMKSGTSKTTKGIPDTYFRKDNGKYAFAVYTTQQKDLIKKIMKDVDDALDPSKTGVAIEDIDEIICCHTSSTLTAGKDKQLHDYCSNKGIILTMYGVDEIAQEVCNRYPTLAKDLGIELDTHQIMSVTDFIKYYDSNEMAAPLSTQFLFRQEELLELENAIQAKRVVVIHGAAGVGKTRIAIEVSKKIAEQEQYTLLCVKSNNLPLYEDLVACTETPGKYLFFIDDANELSGLNLILEYANRIELKNQIKVILTVRDYALKGVLKTVYAFASPAIKEIKRLKDEDIIKFLDVNMNIRNEDFVDQIVRIAEGNLRIAYMTGKLSIDKSSLSAIRDASDVYERYYSVIIDSDIWDNRSLSITAGILALVNAVLLDRLDCFKDLLAAERIPEDEFIDCIRQLSSMELVEIHVDKVAAISDQCFANYMLYYAFFLKRNIPFSKVLIASFSQFKNGIVKAINTLLNIFSKPEVHNYMSDEVRTAWKSFEEYKSPCFEDFAKTFHVFQPEAAFIIAKEKIDLLPQEKIENILLDFNKGRYRSDDDILDYLTGYNYPPYLKTVFDLLIEYAGKSAENALIAYNWLKTNYDVNADTLKHDFFTEMHLLEYIATCSGGNEYVRQLLIEYVIGLLSFEFSPVSMARENAIRLYRFQIKNSKGVNAYRRECWNIILSNLQKDQGRQIVPFIKRYAKELRRVTDWNIVSNDKPYVDHLLAGLPCPIVSKLTIVRDLQYAWNERGYNSYSNSKLFQLDEWKLLCIFENQYLYTDISYEEGKAQRSNTISQYAASLNIDQFEAFIKLADRIASDIEVEERFSVNDGVSQIVDEICLDRSKAISIFILLMKYGHHLSASSAKLFQALFEFLPSKEIWELIQEQTFPQKTDWEYWFFHMLPENAVNEEQYALMLGFLERATEKPIQSSPYRNMRFLDKFIAIHSDVYVLAARIIFRRKEYNAIIVNSYFSLLFYEKLYSPQEVKTLFASDLALLRDIYMWIVSYDTSVDYQGSYLAEYITIDDSWINAYATMLSNRIINESNHSYHQLNALWLSEDYLNYIDAIFNKVAESTDRFSSWRIADAFRSILSSNGNKDELYHRKKEWLMHAVRMLSYDDKIEILFSAITEISTELRKEAFEVFLSCNTEYEWFAKLPLDPSHWGGMEAAIISDLQDKISFLNSLLPLVSGGNFVKHSNRIRERIDMWKYQIKVEEMDAILRTLYL